MTLEEIEKSLRNARLQLGNRTLKGASDDDTAFDIRMRKKWLIDSIVDLKRRRRELLATRRASDEDNQGRR